MKKVLRISLIIALISCGIVWAEETSYSNPDIEKCVKGESIIEKINNNCNGKMSPIIMEKLKRALKRSYQYPVVEYFGKEVMGEPLKVGSEPKIKRTPKGKHPKIDGPIFLDGGKSQGNVSTTPSGTSTWLGGWGTGGCTNGQSYWFRYIMQGNESISWILKAEYETADYDLYLWDYPNHSTVLASAISTSYPDTLKYTAGSGGEWVFLEVDFYGGNQNDIFYVSNVKRPTSSSNSIILSNWALRGETNPNSPTDGIEGYHPYLPSERSHWYAWVMPFSYGWLKLCLRDVSGGVDYDLEVFDSGLNLITGAWSTVYPDVTDWIDCTVYYGQPIYLKVYAFQTSCAEYRVDFYDWSGSAVEEEKNCLESNVFGLYPSMPNPVRNISLVNYAIEKRGNVNLSLFDAQGRKISILVDKVQLPGKYSFTFDFSKNYLPNGIYFYRLESNGLIETEKIVFLK